MTSLEEKIRVNARIPKSLYDFVCSEYDNVSQAINEGLEKLRESKTCELSYEAEKIIQDSHTQANSVIPELIDVIQEHIDVIQISHRTADNVIRPDIQVLTATTDEQKARIEEYKAQVQTLNGEISRLKYTIMEAPDPMEFIRLRERNEGLNLLLEERNKRIDDLTKYKEDISAFANYFKSKKTELIEASAAEKVRPWWKFW